MIIDSASRSFESLMKRDLEKTTILLKYKREDRVKGNENPIENLPEPNKRMKANSPKFSLTNNDLVQLNCFRSFSLKEPEKKLRYFENHLVAFVFVFCLRKEV